MEISVIIPIYNTERYLKKCLNSVFLQSLDKNLYEVIAINDGSTDNSLTVLEQFSKDYNSLKIINQQNNGVTIARKNGVINSKGKYIMFVDSDDYLEPNGLEVLYKNIVNSKADISVGNIRTIKNKKINSISSYTNEIISKKTYLKRLIERKIHWGPISRLFKKELFDYETFKIPRELATGEDAIMNKNLALNAKKISFTPEIVYNYVLRSNSAMGFKFERRTEERLKLFTELMKSNLTEEYHFLETSLLHFDFYNWLFYAKHGVIIKKLRNWNKKLYLDINKKKPNFIKHKEKLLFKLFRYQIIVNLYFYLSSIYRFINK